MSGNRTSRVRLLTAAASVAIAALSLTACNDGSGVKDEGASAASSSAASSSSSSAPAAAKTDSKAPAASQGADDAKSAPAAAATKQPAASTNRSRPVTCQGSNTKTVAAPLTRPLNHMLLTVTNTGAAPCYLYGYPAVRFTGAQSVPPVDENTQPQAVVTLKPGESGYASVRLSAADGSGSNGYTAKDLTVYFQNRSGGSLDSAAHPSLPAEGLHIDDSIQVTYWQQSMDDAISW